jgi:hypothetical protein
MAILVRSPQQYHGLFEHSLTRAGIPGWFDRGTRRPHPAGRAFLALLACVSEGLSARRFAEYLSLGQVPAGVSGQQPVPVSDDELFAGFRRDVGEGENTGAPKSIPAPRRWERLIVEASVIGGDPARWARRLDGLAAEYGRQLAEARREDPASARSLAIERDLVRLGDLRAFAMPLVTQMAAWPQSADWSVWLRELEAFAPRVVHAPAHVLRVLADLRPMGAVGPVSLDEVRTVLSERLRVVQSDPPSAALRARIGHDPAQARGRAFRVVFVPGLAERMFPQKPRQDPLLPDDARERLERESGEKAAGRRVLATRTERGGQERLLLHLAVGAAAERLYVSYPRLEIAESRARVPSFYALDVRRGATGRIPDHDTAGARSGRGRRFHPRMASAR